MTGFQSTPSARRATWIPRTRRRTPNYFNPRPPRGGRRIFVVMPLKVVSISIHALREEGDGNRFLGFGLHILFQSTPSARRATIAVPGLVHAVIISIHALREEGDRKLFEAVCCSTNFNPRPPRGGRPTTPVTVRCIFLFQSTPSARRATGVGIDQSGHVQISIHALREEGDGVQPLY